MTLINRLTTRPGLARLEHGSLLRSLLSKRSSQCYTRPPSILPSEQRVRLSPPRYNNHRYYQANGYGYYTPASFWARNKATIVVGGAISLCCGTYACQWTAERLALQGDHTWNDVIRRNFVNSPENVMAGRWWVILNSSFAHTNLLHLGVNMFGIWDFGKFLVGLLGVPHFVGFWVTSACACSIASNYWESTRERLRAETAFRRWDNAPPIKVLGIPISRERALAISGGNDAHGSQYGGSVGASGVLCGLTGFLLGYAPRTSASFFFLPAAPLWIGGLVFSAGSAYCMATGNIPSIGHAGHLGGLAAGFAYYYGVARPWLRRSGRF